LSNRQLIAFAIVFNVITAVVTYTELGWNSAAGHAAARNTARFAVLLFLAAFSAPGLRRVVASLPSSIALVHSYVSAHVVHFVTVVIVVVLDKTHFLRQFSVPGLLTVAIGASVVIGAGLTASVTSIAKRVIHEFCMFAVFAIFFLDYLKHPEHSLRWFAVPLAVAFVFRVGGMVQGRARSKMAVAGSA
jgi:hypothetical protein